jgi:hypothetical protein
MHVVVNQKLVRNKVRLASLFHLTALAVFAVGLWLSWVYPDQILGSYVAIIVGLLLYQFGQVFLRRWGPRFRTIATRCSRSRRPSCRITSWSARAACG